MPWEIPTDNYDPDSLDGFDNPVPGRYHVQVVNVEEDATSRSGSPQMVVDYQVLAGVPANQEGKTQRDYFAKTDAAVKRALLFAVAVGLTTKDELAAAKKNGKNPILDFSKACSRQLCIEIDAEEYEGKTRNKVGFGIWPLDSDKAKDIPKNQGALNRLGDAAPDPVAADDDNFF